MGKKISEVSNAVVIVDDEGIIYKINSVAARMFGYLESELIGQPVSVILPSTSTIANKKGGLIFELLSGQVEQLYKQGVKKDGSRFAVDIFFVPFSKDGVQYYDCIVKDDSSRFFHERLESLSNVILRRVLIGEHLDQFADFIVGQLSIMFALPLIWIGQTNKEDGGVHVLSVAGELSDMVSSGLFYTSTDSIVHPAVKAVQKMEICFDDMKDESGNSYRLMAFPFLSKKEALGVLTILAPTNSLGHLVLNRLENVALRLGMILQISADQTFLRLLGTAISTAMNAVMITDGSGRIIWVNDAFTKLSGYVLADVQGKTPDILYSGLHPASFYKNLWDTVLSGKPWRDEIVNRSKDGSFYTSDEMITPILDQDGKITHFVVVNDDLTARKNVEGRLLYLSNYDPLTDLPNRSLFAEKLSQELVKKQGKKENIAILILDIFGIGRYNDILGHDAGDKILKVVADRLVSCVTSKDLVARLQGDKFGIILRDIPSLEVISALAHKMIKSVEDVIEIDENEVRLSSYIGISLFPNDANTAEKLVNYADMALFKAKSAGINTYFFFSQEMNQEMEERLILERDMRRALVEKQFFLDYQPELDLTTGRVIGFEALVRWRHPEKGLILPSLFISVAEDIGLITSLCENVMEMAFEQIKEWNNLNLGTLTMAVNLSAAQFQDENLLPMIQRIIEDKNVDARTLEVELTESLLMKNAKEADEILKKLSELGIGIAIDDFGTGYSSLSYLHKFSVDKLKVDKSFVRNLETSRENAEIIKAIVSLGHALNLKIIAEGCENKEQMDLLKELGCDSVQGFYLSRPLSVEKAEEFLRKRNSK